MTHKATAEMRQVEFPLKDRLVLMPVICSACYCPRSIRACHVFFGRLDP